MTIFLCVASILLGYLARSWRIETIEARADRWAILANKRVQEARDNADDALRDLAAEVWAHAATKARVANLEADLIEAGREASTHAGHLEALLEATQEPALRLVKGARNG